MWSTRKRRSGPWFGHDKRGILAFDTVSLHSNLGSPRRNYFSIITTDLNVLHFASITSKTLLKLHHWWLKNKERKVDFRFVERKFLAAIKSHRKRGRSARASPSPHHTLDQERTAHFTARPFSALAIACVASVPVRSERNSGSAYYKVAFGTSEKWGESKKVKGRGWGRGKKGTLARKPLDFENPFAHERGS